MEILYVAGLVLAAIGWILVLVEAFRTGIIWGLCSLLIPLVGFFFVLAYWSKAKTGFLLNVLGCVLMFFGRAH